MNDFFASPLTTEINESGTQIKTDGTTIYCEKSDSKFVITALYHLHHHEASSFELFHNLFLL